MAALIFPHPTHIQEREIVQVQNAHMRDQLSQGKSCNSAYGTQDELAEEVTNAEEEHRG